MQRQADQPQLAQVEEQLRLSEQGPMGFRSGDRRNHRKGKEKIEYIVLRQYFRLDYCIAYETINYKIRNGKHRLFHLSFCVVQILMIKEMPA